MPLTPVHILEERREAIKNSFTGCEFFQLKVGWPVSSDSAHFELIIIMIIVYLYMIIVQIKQKLY